MNKTILTQLMEFLNELEDWVNESMIDGDYRTIELKVQKLENFKDLIHELSFYVE